MRLTDLSSGLSDFVTDLSFSKNWLANPVCDPRSLIGGETACGWAFVTTGDFVRTHSDRSTIHTE